MTEVKAREIVESPSGFKLEKDQPYTIEQIIHAVMRESERRAKSEGYLQALEDERKRAEPLVDIIQKILNIHADGCENTPRGDDETWIEEARQVRSQYLGKEGKWNPLSAW